MTILGEHEVAGYDGFFYLTVSCFMRFPVVNYEFIYVR
jgi:hypothetical protein